MLEKGPANLKFRADILKLWKLLLDILDLQMKKKSFICIYK